MSGAGAQTERGPFLVAGRDNKLHFHRGAAAAAGGTFPGPRGDEDPAFRTLAASLFAPRARRAAPARGVAGSGRGGVGRGGPPFAAARCCSGVRDIESLCLRTSLSPAPGLAPSWPAALRNFLSEKRKAFGGGRI